MPPGIIRGDTHVTTVLGGVHYDLQAFGDFLAFESKALGTSFRVITRQKPLNGNNSVAFTTAVAMQMGQTNVAVCLPSQLVIDDEERDLSSGNSIVTRGGVLVSRQNNRYMVYGKSGEIVQIDVSAYIDIALYLPYEERDKSGGILSSMEGNYLQASDGTKYAGPVKWTDFKNFARSWPSVGKQPAACGVSAMQQSFPERPVYADDLGADAARSARASCAASGVKDSALADDCALDTIILNDPSAAAGFINDPSPKTVIKIIP